MINIKIKNEYGSTPQDADFQGKGLMYLHSCSSSRSRIQKRVTESGSGRGLEKRFLWRELLLLSPFVRGVEVLQENIEAVPYSKETQSSGALVMLEKADRVWYLASALRK